MPVIPHMLLLSSHTFNLVFQVLYLDFFSPENNAFEDQMPLGQCCESIAASIQVECFRVKLSSQRISRRKRIEVEFIVVENRVARQNLFIMELIIISRIQTVAQMSGQLRNHALLTAYLCAKQLHFLLVFSD